MMLEKIQQSMNNPIMKFVMFLIIVFFIGAGYFGANMFGGDPNRIAEVDGVSISSQRVQRQIDLMRQRDAQGFEQRYPTEASREQLRQTIERQLINDEVVVAGVARAGFAASEAQVKDWIRTNEAFQIAGEYSPAQAKEILRQNGMSEDRLAEMARESIAREQLQDGLNNSGFALPNEVETLYRLQEQTRDVRVLRVPVATFAESVTFDEDAINDYYQKNQEQFKQPEQINLKYVRLSADNLIEAKKSEVTEAAVQEYYEQQKSNYQEPAEIQVAHILIDNSVESAKAKAENLLEEIKQGADFATLAEEHSSDTFSAENGGQLDWVDAVEQSAESAGTGWDPEFEKAALALEAAGDVSDVVESQFGFHIIKLVERRGGSTTPLAEVRDDIIEALAKEAANDEFYTKESKLDEALFEYGDDINKFAEQVGLDVAETGMFSKQNATGVAAEPALLEKAFTAQVIDSKEVSDKIELGSKDIIYVTATDYQAESVKPLQEVREQIVKTMTQQKAAVESEAFANEVLAALAKRESTESLISEKGLSWQENTELKRRDSGMKFDLVSAVYQLPASLGDETVYDVKPLSNGDYAVIELKGINYPDPEEMDNATRTQLEQMAKNLSTQDENSNVVKYFQSTVEVKR
ncbi:SurA N-terminal domain-containing protein [Kangiella shandongensis]|uniref:SurA N-terminal domain-containing protein n=1 Tax=Kangiella shandongensis TaxID=2763258 RepID=UPI001CBD5BF8|nr:SurA N-terminal domain-containing protein [Kangiella shandongensis]